MRNLRRKCGLMVGCCLFGTCSQAMAQLPDRLAQAGEPEGGSFLVWLVEVLGLFGLLALLTGVVIFFGACLVVFLARRPAVIASYFAFLLLPLLLAITGALKGLVGAFSLIARADVDLKQSQIFGNITEVLVLPLSALLVTIPSYFVLAIGLFVRMLLADKGPATGGRKENAAP